MDSFRNSFKSHQSYKKSQPWNHEQEDRPILEYNPVDRQEVEIKIDTTNNNNNDNFNNIYRQDSSSSSNYEYHRDFSFPHQPSNSPSQTKQVTGVSTINEDPPSRLINSFVNKQRAAGAEMALDVDFDMDEFKKSSRELRISFANSSCKSSDDGEDDDDDDGDEKTSVNRGGDRGGGEVLRCSSNASFQKPSGLLRIKTRSRLMDPAPPISPPTFRCGTPEDDRRSGMIPKMSELLKSGILGKAEEDDDDPFLDDDIPEVFNNNKLDMLAILQWVSLIIILIALICSLSVRRFQEQTLMKLHLWKWEVMILALICGRLLSGWVIRIAVFFCERNFLLRKKVLYFVYGLRKAVQNCLWLGLVLMVWCVVLDKNVERQTDSKFLPNITRILICLLVTTIIWLVKILLIKVLASCFHVNAYFERIQDSLFKQYVIETLSGPPLVEIQHNREEEDRVFAEVQKLQNAGATIPNDLRAAALRTRSGRVTEGSEIGTGGAGKIMRLRVRFSEPLSKKDNSKQQDAISIDKLHKLNQKNVSASNMKRLMRIVKRGTLTTLDEQLAREQGEDESAMQIRSEYEAKSAAKKIFTNVAKPGSKHVFLSDLMRFMWDDEAVKTMSLFEGAVENDSVSRRSLKNWVVNAFRERRALSLTLNDTKTAVNKIHQMANIVVAILVLSIWLMILNVATFHFLAFLASNVLMAVFMFGNSLKMVFEAIIFLFVMHPFDVGDRCEIDGVQMFVEEMNILTTIFLRYDNQKITYPNSVLATLPIGNFYRSPDMGDSVDFCCHVSTPLEKIAIMKERILTFMESKKEHWYPGSAVVVKDVDDMNRLKMSIWMRHRINFQDMGTKWNRRELVVREMIKVMKELDIEYRMLPLDVNVRDMPAATSNRIPSNWTTCS